MAFRKAFAIRNEIFDTIEGISDFETTQYWEITRPANWFFLFSAKCFCFLLGINQAAGSRTGS